MAMPILPPCLSRGQSAAKKRSRFFARVSD
jgi:hypothetical protein